MTDSTQDLSRPSRQDRPSVAAIPVSRSLRVRLAIILAAAIGTVVGVTTYLETRRFEGTVEAELNKVGGLTAMAVADDLELLEGPLEPQELSRHLHGFIDSHPDVHGISLVTMQGGQPTVLASTAPTLADDSIEVGRLAIEQRDTVKGSQAGIIRCVAVPLIRNGRLFGAVSVSVSFGALDRVRTTGRFIAAWATLIACAILFLLVELLARWHILRPIDAIRATMAAAGQGDLSVRAAEGHRDELGAVACGLNQMLAQMQDLHGTLQQRVQQATVELRERNRELVSLYQQLFKLREQLGRAEQMAAVGETASVVAHQIGTPLNLVSGHIQVLIEEQGADSPVTRRLQVAEEQIRKVTAVVRSLLDRSRSAVVRERLDPGALVRRIGALVQPALGSAGVALVLDTGEVTAIDADASQLEMALLNLVSNALDAMPAGGTLTLRVADSPSGVIIDVGDTGSGIDPEMAERIFEPWVTTKPAGRGTGLGLSITRSVVTDHGGTVRARSAPGVGTTFVVELPRPTTGGGERA